MLVPQLSAICISAFITSIFFTIVLNLLYLPFSSFASSAAVKSCKVLSSSSKGSQWIAWFRRSSWSQRRSGYETKLKKNYQLKRNRHTNKANLLKDFPCPGIKLKLALHI